MTQHKVLSDDSMTAMDEIARVLGQDAVILSTKKIGQKIEIIGSNDIKDILKSSKKNQKKPDFKELFSKAPLSKNISNNKASSESALIHALDHYKKVNKTQQYLVVL